MNHKNTIEINGKLYDAKSGALLGGSSAQMIQPQNSIDGVIKASPVTSSYAKAPKPTHGRSQPNTRKKRNAQKSHTLMRSTVKKPASKNPQNEISSFKRSGSASSSISRSPFVQKFNHSHPTATKRTEHIEVAEVPKPHPKPQDNHSHPTHNPKQTKKHHESVEEIFQRAIAAAPSKKHRSKKERTRASKIGKTATMAATFVLLFGFIAYMNFANLQAQLASTQAGFDASIPSYTVAGYNRRSSIETQPGKISISFTSNTDSRSYQVNQEVSKWSSAALQENFLYARNISYQTTQDAGKTIFLYDEGNATWVNGGVWYTVNSDSLSTEQLVKIASSL